MFDVAYDRVWRACMLNNNFIIENIRFFFSQSNKMSDVSVKKIDVKTAECGVG